MARLTVYIDRTPRSQIALSQLQEYAVDHDVVNVEENPESLTLLEQQGRDRAHYPMPQYYVGETLAWDGFKTVITLTAEQINERINEINASI